MKPGEAIDGAPRSALEQDTWRRFFVAAQDCRERNHAIIHPAYLEHVGVLRPFADHLPTLTEIKGILAGIGWSAAYVDGFAPPWETARMLDRQVMPVAYRLRGPDELYFGSEPDFIHDLFGHLPLLLNSRYRDLLGNWSRKASRAPIGAADQARFHLDKLMMQSQNQAKAPALAHLAAAAASLGRYMEHEPSPWWMLEKIYGWIFEFGLLGRAGEFQLVGAGLLSSLNEIDRLAGAKVKTAVLNDTSIFTPYQVSVQQELYLSAPSWESFDALIAAAV